MKKPGFLKNLRNFVFYIVILIVLIYGIPRVMTWALKTPYPMGAVSSSSMWPTLEKGDLAFIRGIEKEEIKAGDIVVYRLGGEFIIHRVVRLRDETLVTRGDANPRSDQPIGYDKVIGRVVMIKDNPLRIPYLGKITAFVNRQEQ